MKKIVCGMLGLLMIYGGAMAQQKAAGDEAALKALEGKWDAANLKADVAALDTILAETFITTGSEGKVQNKAEILFQLKSGDIKYQTSKGEDMKVFLYGDTGVVSVKWTGKFIQKGKNVDTVERYTDTWVRQNGQWRCVASHGSTIK